MVASDIANDPVAVIGPAKVTQAPLAVVRRPKDGGDRLAKASIGNVPMGQVKPPVEAGLKPGTAPFVSAARSLGAKKPIGSVLRALTASAAMPMGVVAFAGAVAMPIACSSAI